MSQVTCRVPPVVDDSIESAADEVGLFQSDLLKRALLHYIAENPDELGAFSGDELAKGIELLRGGRVAGRSGRSGTYDPTEEM